MQTDFLCKVQSDEQSQVWFDQEYDDYVSQMELDDYNSQLGESITYGEDI